MSRCVWSLFALLPLAANSTAAAQCDHFTVEVFRGPNCGLEGFAGVTPQSIAENGRIAGYHWACTNGDRAFQWMSGPTVVTLPVAPELQSSRAYDVNLPGQIVGYREMTGSGFRGFLFQNGTYTDLGVLPGSNFVEALGINDLSQICGYCNNTSTGPLKAFLWESGRMLGLNLPLGPSSVAYDLNQQMQIVGWMGQTPNRIAFLWQNGVGTSLGVPSGGYASEAWRISDTGHIAGFYRVEISPGVSRNRGFHWYNGVFTDLGLFPGSYEVHVRGINDRGEIAGWCSLTNNTAQAPFIWRDGVMTDLRPLVSLPPNLALREAYDINNQGQIAVSGLDTSTNPPNTSGFRLTPQSSVPGDYDCNHIVDIVDILAVIGHWGPSNGPADFNRDGVVNMADLLIVIENWTY